MDAIHAQLDLFLTGGTYHETTCRYANYVHPDQPLYPARIQSFSSEWEMPDPLIGGLAKRSFSVTLSDHEVGRTDSPTLAAILATENPKGKRARLRLWDPESGTIVNTLNGIISSIGQDYSSLTIEGENPALLQNLLPTIRALDLYPSLDTSQMESKDPPPIVVFGRMPRVTLGCALATILSFTAVVGGGEADKYVYVDMTSIPNYTVASGDRLVYDLFHGGIDWWQSLDLRCSDGTVLRVVGAPDQNGLDARPSTDLTAYAYLKWYRRDIDLSPLVGKTITEYMLGTENNTAGTYSSFIANAYILDADEGKRVVIFDETITSVPLAYQSRNNVATTTTATIDRNWYYGPIRPAVSGSVSATAVYVDGRVRAAGTYVFLIVNGYLMVRFGARPQASQGGVAKVQADFHSTEFASNPAAVAQFVWQDGNMLGQTINAASFITALATYASVGDYEKVVGGLAERKQALQILRDLSFRGAYFDLNDSNQVTMTVDDIAIHAAAPVNLGQQDDLNLRNAEVSSNNSLSNSIANEPKQLDFLAYRDPGLGNGGQPSYLISATRSRSTGGVTITRESPYCGSGKMADRESGYLFAALVNGDVDVEVLTGVTIGKQLSIGQLVRFTSPKHYFSGVQHLLRGIRFDGKQYTLRLTGWDPALYTYTPGKVKVSRLVSATIDYSQTTPSTPTSPTFISAAVALNDEGSAFVMERWRVTLPSVNCTELRVQCYRTGTSQVAPFQSVSKTVITLGAPNDIEIQVPVGMVYDLEFYAFNGGNQPEFRYSLPALVIGHTAAHDTDEPNVPTGLAATVGTGKMVSLNWNDNLELDLSEYRVYRGLTNPPGTLIAEVRASRFVDVNVVLTPPTQYYYAVSSVDRSENESDLCTAVAATPTLIPGTDTSAVIPNTPSAPTFNSEGTYFAADGASVAFIQVTAPAMPTNGAWMNILYRPTGSTAWSIADQVSAGGVNSRVDDLISGRAYQFAAQAFSVFGRGSVVSAVLSRTAPHDTIDPGVPTGLVATVGTGKVVSLNWNDSLAIDLSEYIVYRDSVDPPLVKIAEVAASRFVDVNVSIGVQYYYAVSSVDRSENESDKCTAVLVTPVLIPGTDTSTVAPNTPSAPTFNSEGTYFSSDGTSVAFIEINNPSMPLNAVIMNILYRSAGTSAWGIADQVSTGGGSSRVDDLTPDRDYVFAAQAFSVFGRGSLVGPTLTRTAPHDTSGPSVPTGLTATVGTGKVVSLDWNDSTAIDFSEYRVYRDLFNPPTTKIAEVAGSRFVDVNVTLGNPTPYFYAVSSVDRTENESAKCTAVAATPILIPGADTSTAVPSTPGAPTFNAEGTYLAADGASVAYIEITAPAMPANGAVMNILYRPTGATAWSIADQVSTGGGDSRVDDLTPGRAYQFGVQAFSVFGRGSAVSALLSRTAPFDTSAPSVPVLLTCEPFNQRAILLDWTDNTTSDFNEYSLYRQSFINLVDNYGFEEFEFQDWTKVGTPGGGEAFIHNGVHSGARAANIVSLGTPLLVSQNISVTNGVTYTLAGWARITSRTSGTATIRVNIGNGSFVTALSLSAVGEWTFGDVTFVAAGTTAQVQCFVTGGPLTGYFDDIALFAGTPNPTTKIAEVRASRFTDSQFFLVGTVYYYAVAAIDRTENESAKSNLMAATPVRISNEDLSKYTPQPLGALLLSSVGTYQSNDGTTLAFVNVAWTNPTDGNRAYVEVAYRRTGNAVSYLIADQVTGTTARVDDLTPGLTYDYRVRGLSQVGVFGPASTLGSQIAPGDTTGPAQVTGLALSDHPPRGILARWNAVSADDLAHYQVQSDRNSGFTNATGHLITRTVKTTELPLVGLTNGITYFVRVRALDLTGNSGAYSATMSRTVPRSGEDDQEDESITTLKLRDLSVTNAKIGALAVDNAKIANLSAGKITTGLLAVNPTAGGATAILVSNAGKIRVQAITGTPSRIVFEDSGGSEKAQIQGKPNELDIDPSSDGGLALVMGQPSLRWDIILMQAVNTISAKSDTFFIDAKLGTPNFEAAAPALTTPNRRFAVYNQVGSFVGYLWGSSS